MASTQIIRYKLLLAGYFREMEDILNSDIPKEIKHIIILYQRMLSIFGIGGPGEMMGVNEEKLMEFTLLTSTQELVPSVDSVYRNNKSIMIITQNNELYAIGNNHYDRLGMKTDTNLNQFTKIMDNVKLVSTGCENNTNCFIYTLDHRLLASGANYSGNFGNGQKTNSYADTQILEEIDTKFLQNKGEYITKIELGPNFSLFLTNYGDVFSCGSGAHGHDEYLIATPTLINMNNDNEPIIDIGCGYFHSLALDEKHRLIGLADNEFGQINSTEWDGDNQPPAFHAYFAENKILIKSIHVGYCHNLVIDMDGNGYLFGRNDDGQIGNGTKIDENDGGIRIPFKINDSINDEIVDGSCGDDHSVLLTKSNNVIVFGYNNHKQCCPKNELQILKPYTLSKKDEIGIDENTFIERVMAINTATLIFVDPYKN